MATRVVVQPTRDEERSLQLDRQGIARLERRLRTANRANPTFGAQFGHLRQAIETVLGRLMGRFGPQIERVMAVGVWADQGIDLRNLPFHEVALRIVLRSADRPFALYEQIAAEVFADLDDEEILIQFGLDTLPEWQHVDALARAEGRLADLGVPLLVRG